MKTLTIRSNRINLAAEIVRRLNGKKVEIVETREGVLLRPVENAIKVTRGFLKGKGLFSVKKFMSQRQKEKEFE